MDVTVAAGFLRFFGDLPDPRGRNKIHQLDDMIVIAVMAVICGANSWAEVALFGRSKQTWLSTFLALPDGIPFHDTFTRVTACSTAEDISIPCLRNLIAEGGVCGRILKRR